MRPTRFRGVIGFGDQKYSQRASNYRIRLGDPGLGDLCPGHGQYRAAPCPLRPLVRVQTSVGTPVPRSQMVSGPFYSATTSNLAWAGRFFGDCASLGKKMVSSRLTNARRRANLEVSRSPTGALWQSGGTCTLRGSVHLALCV